jgi:hypothetical protein
VVTARHAAEGVAAAGGLALALYLLWPRPAPVSCPPGEEPLPCPPGYEVNPLNPGCCIEIPISCPSGEVLGPCPTGYIPDPLDPGCCYTCGTSSCELQECPSINPNCLVNGAAPVLYFPGCANGSEPGCDATCACQEVFGTGEQGGIQVEAIAPPTASGALPVSWSLFGGTGGGYVFQDQPWPGSALSSGTVNVGACYPDNPYSASWAAVITYADGTTQQTNAVSVSCQ